MAEHLLRATPPTVHWGFLDGALPAAVVIDSGDRVTIETVNGQARDLIGLEFPLLADHAEILRHCAPRLGPHILTGPVGVRGAEPGDVLEVRVLDVRLRQNWGWNAMRPLRGSLPEEFCETRLLHVPIDRERMVASLPFGVELPLHPFFGIMAVGPRKAYGAVSTIEPREYGGNIDNKELGPGSRVFFPVQTPGALFSAGDGHAVQGDGEVNLTALETSLTGTFEFHLHKGATLRLPVAITPTDLITMAFHEDLDVAAREALREMIHLLRHSQGWRAADAYAFCSMACNLRITQMVDGNKGVHAMVRRGLIGDVTPQHFLPA
ncbi:MAG TPA: acetamidase/formamidase family protein [Burkholderiaceae bacterium]|nr:acetamidase/formamidase family protein [Burkholderiaceae bacterium]